MNFSFTPEKDCGEFSYSFSFTSAEFQLLKFSDGDEPVLKGLLQEISIADKLTALALIAKRAEDANTKQPKE